MFFILEYIRLNWIGIVFLQTEIEGFVWNYIFEWLKQTLEHKSAILDKLSASTVTE